MAKYCTNCGNPVDEAATYCANCGVRISTKKTATPAPAMPKGRPDPEVESILSLNGVAGILALILGIIMIIIAAIGFFIFFAIGVFFLIFGIVDLLIWNKLRELNDLVEQGVYRKAKDEQLTWAILGLILGGVIIGIVLLIAYLKYDEILRLHPQ
jgi:hypothetical protein